MNVDPSQIEPFGDAALLVSWPGGIDPATNDLVHALAERLRSARREGAGWGAPVPSYSSLLATFDPLRLGTEEARSALLALLQEPLPVAAASSGMVLEVPVRYGGTHGPDLEEVARRTGLSPAQVIELHAARTYRAYLLGFAPGFAYLGTLPPELHLPRRATPRQRVPAGSVAIAAAQTAVYPLATPGGWHLLGRTELRLWDAQRDPPALIRPGQVVRFVPLPG
ncbi:MAG TPA: 5-oxoprolinase subunit PxpB [Candidatus Limnocylindria bacterium]|nr:5-oxoprolinase subunit PxpB [Candidatus Limnocylindria bacterium]